MAERDLTGSGRVEVHANRDALWDAFLDPGVLKSLIPGAESVERPRPDLFRARLSYGVGRFRSRYDVELSVDSMTRPSSLALSGRSGGLLGRGEAVARVSLDEITSDRTLVTWGYDAKVSGAVALAGMGLLNGAAARFVDGFFRSLSEVADARLRRVG